MGLWGSKPKAIGPGVWPGGPGRIGPAPIPTVFRSIPTARATLLKDTTANREFMNFLFQQMIERLTPEDFLKLGNPAQCSKYIILMADSLNKLFNELQVYPRQDKQSGMLIFQKIDDITKNPQSGNKQLCTLIAYYYIRVFQIFGALAMTIVDDPGVGQILGLVQQGYQQGYQQQPLRKEQGFVLPPGFRGGAMPSQYDFRRSYPNFAVLYPELNLEEGRQGFGQRNKYSFIGTDQLTFDPSIQGSQNLIFKNDSIPLKITCVLSITKGLQQDIQITRFNMDKIPDELKETKTQIQSAMNQRIMTISTNDLQSGSVGTTIADRIQTRFDRVMATLGTGVSYNQGVKREAGIVGRPSASEAQTIASIKQYDVGVTKMLQNGYIIATLKNLSGYKTTAFCVARALQLIDANYQLNPTRPPLSSICKSDFKEVPNSVPTPGKSIASVPGFRATEQLFFTNPSLETVAGKSQSTSDDPAAYTAFLQEFQRRFGSQSRASLTSLDTIMAASPQCASQAVNKYLQIQDSNDVKNIIGYVNQLFKRQLDHTNAVIHFIRTDLLAIKTVKDPRTGAVQNIMTLHPKLLGDGLQQLAKLSAKARGILIEYYMSCDNIYKDGVKAVNASRSSFPI